MSDTAGTFILTLSCPDGVGIVAAVTTLLAGHGALITEAQHFLDAPSNSTVLRIVFRSGTSAPLEIEPVSVAFAAIAGRFGMQWQIRSASQRLRVLVAVSKDGHCLKSLLHRWEVGTLHIDVVGVVSNHADQRRVAEWHNVPFHYLPIDPGGKARQEQRLLGLFEELAADLLVLARYMQILSAESCERLRGRAINIHHSFLPSFKGPRPYHQAYARGVKLIGATAHYINCNLDEGPIIEQAVERVDHGMSPEQLTAIGGDIENAVLNRAVQWHAEHRIFEFNGRTVVLR